MAFQSSVNPAQLTQLGQANLAGDKRALYLKLFSGEMFKGFQNNTIARDLIMKRTLKNGKSLQFIFTGRTKSEFHTPGNSILGDTNGAPPVAEKTITIDDLLISSASSMSSMKFFLIMTCVARSHVRSAMLLLKSMTVLHSVLLHVVHVRLHLSLQVVMLSQVVHRSV